MVLIAAFMTQVGALQTAPILIAVVTAFLIMEGVKYLVASRKRARAAAAKQAASSSGHSAGDDAPHRRDMARKEEPMMSGRLRLYPEVDTDISSIQDWSGLGWLGTGGGVATATSAGGGRGLGCGGG